MNEKEKDNLIKLLIGIILVLMIGFGGYYIYVTQSRISKLEKETAAKNEKSETTVNVCLLTGTVGIEGAANAKEAKHDSEGVHGRGPFLRVSSH